MKRVAILTTLICFVCTAFAQNNEEEAVKKAIQAEVDAIAKRDFNAYQAVWQHDANAVTTFTSHYGYNTRRGWDSIGAATERDWKADPKPQFSQIKIENCTVRMNGNVAVVDYDAVVTPVDPQPNQFPYLKEFRNHNYETLVKDGDQWKVMSRVITQPETYAVDNDQAVETDINAMGYELIYAKKLNEAIEILKLNTKFFPNSFNTFDSLGEAYALAGNKKMAIENYEKSLKLNPKNTNGQEALVKLKAK